MTNEPEPNTRAGEAFDPPCTDCGDTGVTFQTERACTCDAATRPLPQPSEDQPAPYTCKHSCERDALMDQIAKLQARLEVVPGWSEDADGIACRNDTIKLQDECIAKLQADGDKLAGALEMIAAGHGCPSALATATLTEWKDRA